MNVRQMGRAAAAVGALVAAGAAALVAVGGTANAAGAGRCTDNVNVREEPDTTAKIVAVCERGQAVQVGKTSDGFVQLTDLGGWAAQEYVSVDGKTPAAPAARSSAPQSTTRGHGTDDATDERGAGTGGDSADVFGDGSAAGDRTTDGTTTDGGATDGSATDGSATDGSATDGTTNGGAPNGGAPTGTATDGTSTGGANKPQAPAMANPLGSLFG